MELAVAGKHVKVLEVLCMFGADLVMQDWVGIIVSLMIAMYFPNIGSIVNVSFPLKKKYRRYKQGEIRGQNNA